METTARLQAVEPCKRSKIVDEQPRPDVCIILESDVILNGLIEKRLEQGAFVTKESGQV